MSTNDPNLPPDASSASLFAEGQKLAGCYALSRRLMVGDGPEVWLATDEVLGKDVSLHILPAAIIKDAAALQEVRAEVKRNRQLINPQILRVFDLVDEPQWAAVSMNTFEGESLAYRLSKQLGKRFAATEVGAWVTKLIQTIEDAHRIHFLHRDLAPENIFLTPAGQPLVAYFAISRKIQDALARVGAADEARLAYVSPQTLAGEEPARTDDVYSLAAVLYTVLVGVPPFVGANIAGQVRAGVSPETLSALGREDLQIPPAWREAIAAGLRRSPKGRPQSAAEFLKILKGEASAPAPGESEEEKAPTPSAAPAAPKAAAVVPAPVPVPVAKVEAPAPAAPPAAPAPQAPPVAPAPSAAAPTPVTPPPAAAPVEPAPKAEEVKKEEVVAPIVTPPPAEKLEAVVKPEPKADAVAPEVKPEVAAPEAKPAVAESKPVEPEVKPAAVEPAPAKSEPSPAVPVSAPAAPVTPAAPAAPASAPATSAPAPATPPAPAAPTPPVSPSPTEPKKPAEPAIAASSEAVPPKVEPKKLESVAASAEVLPPRVEPKKPAAPQGPGTADVMPPRGPTKPYQRPPLTEFKPRLYPEESRRMSYIIGIAALVLVALGIYFLSTYKKSTSVPESHFSTPVAVPPPTPIKEEAQQSKTPAPTVIVASGTPAPSTPVPAQTPTPPPAPTPAPPDATSPSNLQKVVVEKQAALEQAKQAVAAAEKAHADRLKAQQTAEAAVVDSQRAVETKSKSNDVIKASVTDIASQRQKLEDSQKAAQAAADQAQKLAQEKAQVVEQGKKALADLEKEKSDKLAVQDKANAELAALQQAFAEKQRAAAEAAKAVSDADAARQQQLAAVNKNEQDLASAKSALEMHDSLATKLDALRKMQNGGLTPATTPVPAATPLAPPVKAATPAPNPPSLPTTPAPTASLPATPAPSTPVATAPAATPVPGANSLGMKFVPVGDVEFAVWLVRLQDFRIFAKAVNLKSTSWESPGFKQEPDHPVVNVTWIEALAFCKWLTDKERKEGSLPANQYYRLPTDLEWSKAVGLPEETGKTPEQRDMGVPDVYPWGAEWPPPKGAGNYTGEETGSDVAIKGYDDGYAWTSPVGSFRPNKYGLYDMGGNVWQWCMDSWNTESKAKVLRGASWYNGALKLSLLSSCRVHAAPDSSTDNYGFRLVRATESVKGRFR